MNIVLPEKHCAILVKICPCETEYSKFTFLLCRNGSSQARSICQRVWHSEVLRKTAPQGRYLRSGQTSSCLDWHLARLEKRSRGQLLVFKHSWSVPRPFQELPQWCSQFEEPENSFGEVDLGRAGEDQLFRILIQSSMTRWTTRLELQLRSTESWRHVGWAMAGAWKRHLWQKSSKSMQCCLAWNWIQNQRRPCS